MIDTTAEYLTAIVSDERQINVKCIFNGNRELSDDIISASIEEISNAENALTIGEINSTKAIIKFKMPENKIPLKGGNVKIQSLLMVGNEYESINKGTFYIAEIDKSDNTDFTTVFGYDSAYRLNVIYEPGIVYPNTLDNVVNDICDQCNITNGITNMPSYEISGYPENTTCKQFLGYMLGLMGKNGMISPDDKLVAYWYTDSDFNIDYDIQYMNGFNRTTDEDITINSLTSGSEDNVLVSGSGFGITFENPYMTQDILDDICENICPFTYTPCNVSWRGNPALQISDIVKVEDKQGNYYNVLLNEHTLLLTGMNSSIVCKGETEIDAVMSQSPTDIKLNKLYGTLTDAFKNTTDRILGNQGGYYKVDMNEEGFPSGWTIMNTPELTDSTHLWKFTSGGLGYSEDGGKTFTNIAFDLEGNFNANAITTGILQGEMFELNLMTGVIKIGKRDDNGEISNPSFYLNENGELTIQAFDEIQEELKVKKYTVSVENTGTELFMATDTVTLSAKLFADNEDVTDEQMDIQFQWYKDGVAFKTGKSIVITANDIDAYASIYCAITVGDLIKNTQSITITDNNDIANLGNSFLDVTGSSLVQTLDNETYFPDWTSTPAVITPGVSDGFVNVDLSECQVVYKRVVNGVESDLIDGETVNDGVLSISKNVLTKENPSITYVCYLGYKNAEIKLSVSFYLNIVGSDGEDAIMLYIDSSNGYTFKNTGVATTLTVTVIVGGNRLDTSEKLKEYFGEDAYLQWSSKKLGDEEFTNIPITDSRLSDNGFIFTLTTDDVKVKHTFNCDLIF